MTYENRNLEPKIYLACLASYNNGILHGKWVDANLSVEEIKAEIQEMLKSSPIPDAEEYAIHDYDDFSSLTLGEYESIEHITSLAECLSKYGGLFGEVYEYYQSIDNTIQAFESGYIGSYESLADYAIEIISDVPSHLEYYIDYQSMARDMEINGEFTQFKYQGSHHIFLGM